MSSKSVVFVGAGSTVFALTLLNDLCAIETLDSIAITLFDIDERRLQTTLKVAQRLLRERAGDGRLSGLSGEGRDVAAGEGRRIVADEGRNVAVDEVRRIAADEGRRIKVRATLDRDDAIRGADFVLTMFQIGGYRPATVADFEIPKRYGLRQTIGDTLGIGGIMRGLRTIPALLGLTASMKRLCPQALLINYANPMAINCWALAETGVPYIGLCHSVPHTTHELANDLGVPASELQYIVAGINHLAFYLKLERKGADLYPQLRAFMEREGDQEGGGNAGGERFPPRRHWMEGKAMVDHLRYELMRHTGYFVTESSEHLAEYLPYFIKRTAPELIARYQIPLDEYPRRCEEQIAEWQQLERRMTEAPTADISAPLSDDYGMRIIDSIVNNTVRRVYSNVRNEGLISNLPSDAIVEVPCLVDGNGVQPTRIGALPAHLAALMRTNINVQELTARAAIEQRREYVYHAAMLDPHTAAELTIDQIKAMVDELLEAHRDYFDLR